ncbi:MAG TPA: homoserine O-acetyltransferase [Thermoanaerobaculia bacterium]|nr:homoserine O-acetyltransferase [Thermoanaerobaculia bacterium]
MPPYRLATLPAPFRFHRGGELPEITLAYETWGTLSPERDNAVLLTTGLSPGSHARSSADNAAPGWWEEMIGPGRPIDTDRWFVVCNNSLGSCHGSTGPASQNPATGERYRLRFPELAVEDIAASSRALLHSLGIERLAAVIGSSLGGMTSLAYATLFPDEVGAVVSISAATSASAFAIAVRSIQREAIRSDAIWNGGDYETPPVHGLTLARKLGVVSYRSAQEWTERFGRKRVESPARPFGIEFEVEAYLQHHADRFVPTFDANCYLYLSKAMDEFDLAEHGGEERSVSSALRRITARRVLVVGVSSDILFPLSQQEELAEGLEKTGHDVTFEAFPSPYGHDSFLIDLERFGPAVERFLGGE